jgi:F-type H+-transporting ATPase subunit delta
VNPTLQGYAAAIFEDAVTDGPGMAALAQELGAIEQAVGASVELDATLTDTAVPGPVRRAVLADLLAGKVSTPAARLASFAAGSVFASEVPVALGWLAEQATRLANDIVFEEPVLSFTEGRRRVGGFAACVFEERGTEALEQIESELHGFAVVVQGNPALRSALSDRDLPVAVRQEVVDQLLVGKVGDATLRLVRYALAGGRARDVLGTLNWMVEETARARGWRVARVHAAADIGGAQADELAGSLRSLTGSPVELQVDVDPALLSGVVVEVGDLLVDATVRGRLEDLRERLAPAGWQDAGFAHAGARNYREEAV